MVGYSEPGRNELNLSPSSFTRMVLGCRRTQATTIKSPSAPAALKVAIRRRYGTTEAVIIMPRMIQSMEMIINGDMPTIIYWELGKNQSGAAAKA